MNDLKIYQYLARKPGSRAQDIADTMDVDLKVASDALRCLVDVGDLVRYTGTAPNGLPAQLYKLSDDFKGTAAGRAVLASVEHAVAPPPDATPAAAPAPVASPTPPAPAAPEAVPVFAQQTVVPPKRTKIELAIEHLTLYKIASDSDMRIAMSIAGKASPRSWLHAALKAGQIIKDQDGWKLGTGAALEKKVRKPYTFSDKGPKAQFSKEDQPSAAGNVAELGKLVLGSALDALGVMRREDLAGLPMAVVDQPSKPAQALAAEQGVFRCGLWSDGVLELQRDGESVAQLTRGEGEQVADFMTRILGTAPAAVSA